MPLSPASRRRFEFRYAISGEAEPDFLGWHDHGQEERSDIYILRLPRADLLPKLRGGNRLQIKRLMAGAGALQYWIMTVDVGMDAVGAHSPALLPGLPIGTNASGLVDAARSNPEYHVVEVAKQRRLFTKGQVRAEIVSARAELAGSRRTIRSVAFEAANAAEMIDIMTARGVLARINSHYGMLLS